MPSSVTRLVALDHDRMNRLLHRACTPGPSQERWRDELVHLLHAHLAAEEAALSSDVLAPAGTSAVAAAADLPRLQHELRDAAHGVSAAVGSTDLERAGRQLQRLLTLHADALDSQVLRPLEAAAPRRELRRLGGVYAERRDQALRKQGDGDPPPRRLDLSRAELYELAKKAGVEGRSTMSRGDLIAELLRRQQTQ